MTPCPTQINRATQFFTVDKTRRNKIQMPSLNDDWPVAEPTLHTAGAYRGSLIPQGAEV